jgi:hypothetical protein
MPNLDLEISQSVKLMVEFIKENVTANLARAQSDGTVEMTQSQVIELSNLVGVSIDQGFHRGFTEVEAALKKFHN